MLKFPVGSVSLNHVRQELRRVTHDDTVSSAQDGSWGDPWTYAFYLTFLDDCCWRMNYCLYNDDEAGFISAYYDLGFI